MATESLALPQPAITASPLVDRLHGWITTVDHKRLGVLYIGYALLFLSVGGIEAAAMRIQLIGPRYHFVSPQVFNRLFTMHGTTMIFFVVMPLVFGFANYLVPLMIGARDMAFPRLNAFSFWLTGFSGIGTAINILTTILCMRCPGMTLGKMPLFAWLNLTMSAMVILAISPLSAAQIMLLV